jgi:hypothetical protein
MTPRAEWVAHILTYEGMKFMHQGRNPEVGIDCPGPLILGARHFGIKPADFDVLGYSAKPDGSLKPILDEHLVPKHKADLLPGDVVLNAFHDGPEQHISIIVGEGFGQWIVLHASSKARRVQRERIPYHRGFYRYVQGYGVPGVV